MKLVCSLATCLFLAFGLTNTSDAAWSFSVSPNVAGTAVMVNGDFGPETFNIIATNTSGAPDLFAMIAGFPTATFQSGSSSFVSTGTTGAAVFGVLAGQSAVVGTLSFATTARTTPFTETADFLINMQWTDLDAVTNGAPTSGNFVLTVATPEPTTLLMFGAGMTGLCFRRRRRS